MRNHVGEHTLKAMRGVPETLQGQHVSTWHIFTYNQRTMLHFRVGPNLNADTSMYRSLCSSFHAASVVVQNACVQLQH